MNRLLLASALLFASPAAAQEIDWSKAPRVEIVLSNFSFRPGEIRLPAGQPVVLHFRNESPDTHNFTARKFFREADVRRADRRSVAGGTIDLGGREEREVALVPKAGRYPVTCTQQYHETLGMTAEVVVE